MSVKLIAFYKSSVTEKLKALQSEVAQARTKAFEQLLQEVEKERTDRLQEITAERESLTHAQEELQKAQAELQAQQQAAKRDRDGLDIELESIKNRKAALKEKAASLDQRIDEEAGRRSVAIQAENERLNEIIAGLRENLSEALRKELSTRPEQSIVSELQSAKDNLKAA